MERKVTAAAEKLEEIQIFIFLFEASSEWVEDEAKGLTWSMQP
jgi:hypothetical protein